MDKNAERERFRNVRQDLSEGEVAAASAAVCQQLAAWPTLQKAQTAMAYLAFRNEIDLTSLFKLLPAVNWGIPRIAAGRNLIIHPYAPDQLVRHPFGMLEPAADLPAISPATLDVILVPGIAFDRGGGRLGFGGGYYDRLLPHTQAIRVGVTYDSCLVDRVPLAPHDQLMGWVVTPSQLIDCQRSDQTS